MESIFKRHGNNPEREKLLDRYVELLKRGDAMKADELLEAQRIRDALSLGGDGPDRGSVAEDVWGLAELLRCEAEARELPDAVNEAETAESEYRAAVAERDRVVAEAEAAVDAARQR